MAFDADDETPRLFADMSRRAGVSRATLTNWTKREPPLQTTVSGEHRTVSCRQLTAFCQAHPELSGVRKVLAGLGDATAAATTGDRHELDVARSLARAARTAAAANLEALIEAARQAEQNARSHREQLERLREGLVAYEDAVGQFTVPTTLND